MALANRNVILFFARCSEVTRQVFAVCRWQSIYIRRNTTTGSQYFVVTSTYCTFLPLYFWFANTPSRHLLAIVSDRTEYRTTASYKILLLLENNIYVFTHTYASPMTRIDFGKTPKTRFTAITLLSSYTWSAFTLFSIRVTSIRIRAKPITTTKRRTSSIVRPLRWCFAIWTTTVPAVLTAFMEEKALV